MVRKIRAVGLSLIVLIIIAAFSAMSVVQAHNISSVENPSVLKANDSSVVLSWDRVSSADGYNIYQSTDGAESFKKVAEVSNESFKEYTLKDLSQATNYSFYITAFKNLKNNVCESEEHSVVSVCTLPDKQVIGNVDSSDPGQIKLEWKKNKKAAGYQLQYAEGKDFSKARTLDIEDKNECEKTITKLTPKSNYCFRIRSYVNYNNKVLVGEWSETKSVEIAEKVAMPSDIDPKKPMIALTFDDGPGYNKASDKILDVLEKYNARATFFMVGTNAKTHSDNLKRKIKLGCELGNHTYNHDHYGKNVTASDIKKASQAIYDTCGQYPTAFRSTGGNTTNTIRQECKKEKMPLYYWSLDTQDWKSRNAGKVYNAVMKNVEDGDIILMHDIYMSTADAVEKMVPQLIKKGYQLVTVTELIQAKTGKNPVPGQQYVSATVINNKTS